MRRRWRCFHCDEVFTNHADAAEHFGGTQGDLAACQLNATDRDYIAVIRKQEAEIRRLGREIHNETNDALRLLRSIESRYGDEIRRAEDLGFSRGIRDMQRLAKAQFGAEVIV